MVVSLAKDQEKFVLRLPSGMRDRIKESAERNGRSMNAEIIQALEQMYPPQPSLEDVLERVHFGIALAKNGSLPYRQVLVDSLKDLSERISSGIEFDQFRSTTAPPPLGEEFSKFYAARERLRRASKAGVETSDLIREIEKGLFNSIGRSNINAAIARLGNGKREWALKSLNLDVKFADPEEAFRVLESGLRAFYLENWGDPDEDYLPDDF